MLQLASLIQISTTAERRTCTKRQIRPKIPRKPNDPQKKLDLVENARRANALCGLRL